MTFSKALSVALSVALAIVGFVLPVSPAEAASAPSVACGRADAMMVSRAEPKVHHGTGNVDKDFASAMMAQSRTMMALAKVEVECGNNAKAKAAAQAFLNEAQRHMETMDLILHSN